MSLDAGRAATVSTRLPSASSTTPQSISTTLTKAGKTKMTFDAVGIDHATEYAAEKADIMLRLWQVFKPRLAAEHVLAASMRRWSGRCFRCLGTWSGAAFLSTEMCCRGCPASSRRRRRACKTRSTSSPARQSMSARRSRSATFCSASSDCRAAPRPKPANGRPARACSRNWPSRATSYRKKFSTGGRCRN